MRNTTLLILLWAAMAMKATAAEEHGPTGAPDHWPSHMMGDQTFSALFIDRLEYGDGDDGGSRLFDLQGWHGGDYNKLWLEAEGEGATGESLEAVELQVLYDRLVTPFWSLQTGVRHDVVPGADDVTHAAVGLHGLAPQWLETDLGLFVSEHGDVTFAAELEYDLRLTQRLVLQPRLEVTAAADDVPELGIGSGLSSTEAGVRLRYEIRREFAPYVGVRWERRYGDTRDLARLADEPVDGTWVVIGIKAWF